MLVLSWQSATTARAYTISSVISEGCHERVTTEALRTVRLEFETAAPLPATRNEQALIDDVPFPLPEDMNDLGGVTLLLGVRDNDVKGHRASDLSHLALVHSDPDYQREHCLRGLHHLEPFGSEASVSDCRAFIRERIAQALDGLDEAGKPDLGKRTALDVYLALRHQVTAPLPTFYVRMGQALHAIEDSFTHTYRTADGMRITVVTSWIHRSQGIYDESLHGPLHRGALDECEGLDPLLSQRRALASAASTALLRTALDPSQTRAQKLAKVDELLNMYLSYQPGCTYDNNWCEAPEDEYGQGELVSCSLGDPRHDLGALLLSALLLARVCFRRPRRWFVWLSLLCALGWPRGAAAEPPEDAGGGARTSARRADDATGTGRGRAGKSPYAFGASAVAAGSVDHGAIALALGGRLRFREHWVFGLDAEWNPWIADPRVIINREYFRPGVFNAYASAVFRLLLSDDRFAIRSTLGFGFSTMLMDLYGAPLGSTGVFGVGHPLGVEWRARPGLQVIVNPLGIALPTPQLRGVPFVYAQYRFSIAVELYAGAGS